MAATADLVVRITSDTKDAVAGVKDVESASGKMKSGIQSAALPAAAALAAVGAAAMAAGKAAAEDAQGQAILAQNLKNSAGASDAAIAATEDHIAAMSKATGTADDELRPAMSALVMATGDVTKAQDALGVALDVSAATGKSVESVSAAMAKAYAGNTASLKKLVPSLDEATLASGDMDKIMAELAATTGGSAAAAADTAAGKMKIMQNSMSEAQEEIGTALLPVLSSLASVLAVVAGWVQDNAKVVQILAAVVGGLALAVLAVNAAMKVYQATLIVVQVVQKATWIGALGPIALVIAAIMLVVGAVVLLWHKSETFRSVVLGVWGAIRKAIDVVTDALRDTVTWVGNLTGKFQNIHVPGAVKDAVADIRAALEAAWNWAGNLIGRIQNIHVPGAVQEAIAGIRGALEAAWNWAGNVATKISNISVPGTIKSAIDAITGAIRGAIDAVSDLIGWLKNIHVPKIDLPGPFGKSATPTVATPGVPTARGAATSQAVGSGVHITVNGAIDPEATARQIQRILAGHNRRLGLAT